MFQKMSTAIEAAYKKVPTLPTQAGNRWIDKWHGVSGTIQQHANTSMFVYPDGNVSATGLGAPVLTKAKGKELARAIDQVYVGADHLNVKDNLVWQSIYGLSTKPFPFIDVNGSDTNANEDTIPCHNCGILLPMECIQVDHHMPQAGGESLYTLKILRALGLTVQAATGSKGSSALGGPAVLPKLNPKGRARGDYNHMYNTSSQDKWTTNHAGSAFLSLLVLSNALPDLQRMCKNSLYNLVPLCPKCNRIKSDFYKSIA